MPKILILGANGQLACNTIPFFLKHQDVHLTLYLRQAKRLRNPDPDRVTIVEGDVLDDEGKIIANSISEKGFIDINGGKLGFFIKGKNTPFFRHCFSVRRMFVLIWAVHSVFTGSIMNISMTMGVPNRKKATALKLPPMAG